jgi:ferritin-like metal-binding protein YciE
MNSAQVKELVLQSLEHERGGVLVYQTALECVLNEELQEEWEKYLGQTKTHVTALEKVCSALDLDPSEKTPGCKVVKHTGTALVDAMKMALAEGDKIAAELVAGECVVLAETKDHANWELLGKCAEELSGEAAAVLKEAYDRIEDEEDEHLYHSKGWARELWLKSLDLEAVLPPPEEVKDVKSAVAAAKAQKESERSRRH